MSGIGYGHDATAVHRIEDGERRIAFTRAHAHADGRAEACRARHRLGLATRIQQRKCPQMIAATLLDVTRQASSLRLYAVIVDGREG